MANVQRVDVDQTPKNLVGVQFGIHVRETLLAILNFMVEISVIVLHNDVQILVFVVVGHVGPVNFHHKITLEHVHYFDLSILVLLILKNPLHCHHLASCSESPLEDLAKGSLPN